MHTLAILLESIGLLLLTIEAIGERRSSRWKNELEDVKHDAQGRWLMFTREYITLRLAIGITSMVARFDNWKDRRGLGDLFFLFALACGVSGVALSVAFG